MRMKRSHKTTVVAVGLAIAAGSAFTAGNSNTPVASAGFAATTTAGFSVSGVQYDLGAPSGDSGNDVVRVKFTLTPAANALGASQARVRFVTGGAYYDSCDTTDAKGVLNGVTVWTCTTTGLETLAINTLDIVAVSQAPVT